jgi:hypothetical protein
VCSLPALADRLVIHPSRSLFKDLEEEEEEEIQFISTLNSRMSLTVSDRDALKLQVQVEIMCDIARDLLHQGNFKLNLNFFQV